MTLYNVKIDCELVIIIGELRDGILTRSLSSNWFFPAFRTITEKKNPHKCALQLILNIQSLISKNWMLGPPQYSEAMNWNYRLFVSYFTSSNPSQKNKWYFIKNVKQLNYYYERIYPARLKHTQQLKTFGILVLWSEELSF